MTKNLTPGMKARAEDCAEAEIKMKFFYKIYHLKMKKMYLKYLRLC